jgi:hypothetical protein
VDSGDISHYRTSPIKTVHADALKPFGNFFFGYLMTFAGAAYKETKAVATLVQGEGYQQLTSWDPVQMATTVANAAYYGDDPSDRPFVYQGAYLAAQYIIDPKAMGISSEWATSVTGPACASLAGFVPRAVAGPAPQPRHGVRRMVVKSSWVSLGRRVASLVGVVQFLIGMLYLIGGFIARPLGQERIMLPLPWSWRPWPL